MGGDKSIRKIHKREEGWGVYLSKEEHAATVITAGAKRDIDCRSGGAATSQLTRVASSQLIRHAAQLPPHCRPPHSDPLPPLLLSAPNPHPASATRTGYIYPCFSIFSSLCGPRRVWTWFDLTNHADFLAFRSNRTEIFDLRDEMII